MHRRADGGGHTEDDRQSCGEEAEADRHAVEEAERRSHNADDTIPP
jgi:hypothetical protein